MTYKTLTPSESSDLIDWAEANKVDWDIYNSEEILMSRDCKVVRLGLERWPEDEE